MENNKASVLVIFGATGDLSHRKLLPALYFLEYERKLDKDFSIVFVARRPMTDEEFRKEAILSIKKFSKLKIKKDILNKISKRIRYFNLEFNQKDRYIDLRKKISGKCIFYLATSPEFFSVIVKNLSAAELSKSNYVVFEKPFGENLGSAKKLNSDIRKVFKEEQIYRIDHYLAKELVQNLLVMRFGNSIFEPLWNTQYIDHIQITLAETLGVETRGEYYDNNGALKDVVQNHIMQLLCLTAMESPRSLKADDIRDEKVKVLKSILKIKNILKESVKGQYSSGKIDGKNVVSYRDEKGIEPYSTTSSYFAIKFCVNNKKWKNVPFYIRTGKRLKDRATEISIIYKQPINKLFKDQGYHLKNNILTVRVQPDEGISFKFNVKVPGNKVLIDSVDMDFCHECKFGPGSAEAYEKLLLDVMLGDQTLFTRWDEVEHSWKIIDSIRDTWHDVQPKFYKPGTWGPEEADKFMREDGRAWVIPQKPYYAELLKK